MSFLLIKVSVFCFIHKQSFDELLDPEYLEFLELLAKPENLPSAEIQLERKEAERAG